MEVLDQADRFAREAVPAGAAHGRRRMVAARGLPADRRAGLHGHPGARSLRRRRAGPVHQRPGAAGLRALEPRAGAELGGAREPVPEQHLPQRQRGPAPALPARPVQAAADRRAGPDRTRRRQRRDGLDAHHRHAGAWTPTANTTCSTAPRSTSPTARWPTCCWSTPRPTARRAPRASRPSSSRRTSRASGSRRSWSRWATAAARPASWCSTTAACRRQPGGARTSGVKIVMSGLDLERAMVAPLCLGIAERALQISLDYAARGCSSASRSATSRWCRPCWPTCTCGSSRCGCSPTRRCARPTNWKSAAAAAARSTRSPPRR
jgi:hypothetical protein